ncbi:RNA polymerase recycling motor HelD [Mangrovibacillus cuniculi]|uniref:RNA polymerase recycling motor HelD n=1 Tax=Mangrovibacillus cuniculi TaxID=2593652 RepID=UPI001EFA0B8A|nr:RNA polymerase recycling motor HelD [Mangrovibacillus cuniculi]
MAKEIPHVTEHPDYSTELDRLTFTKAYIRAVLKTAETNQDQFLENIQEAFKDEDFKESSNAYTNLLLNASFFSMSSEEIAALKRALDKPYFARMNFVREETGEEEIHYLGKTSLYQRENQEPIIVDWRSPIANLYYEGRIGPIHYEAQGEEFAGNLTLKRQLMVEKGQLEDIRDIDLTTTDELLQESLSKSSSNRLTDIITTIQKEQNKIIRADLNKPILVQGAAGSGKTTIALHRISYFIYQYKQHFNPRQLMILAPSHLFIDYISEALPELGVDKIRQTTFQDYCLDTLEETYTLLEDRKLINLVEKANEDAYLEAWVSGMKGSRTFYQILRRYIQEIENRMIPKDDFFVGQYRLFSKQKWADLFLEDYVYLPIYRRLEKCKSVLKSTVDKKKGTMTKKVEDFYDERIDRALLHRKDPAKRKEYVTKALDKKAEMLAETKKNLRTALPSYMKQFDKKKTSTYLYELYEQPELLVEFSNGEWTMDEAIKLSQHSAKNLKKKKVELEDLAALLFLEKHLYGIDPEKRVKNIVIDEVQDYSYLQLKSLQIAMETDMFTLVGDLAQGIHHYRGIQSWEEVLYDIFPRATYTELQKSYRTTVEIMEKANKLLAYLPYTFPKVEPVVRHGPTPEWKKFSTENELVQQLTNICESEKESGFETIAIITKTKKDAEAIQQVLQDHLPVTLLEAAAAIPKNRVVIVPSYLSKGLEFDVVIQTSWSESFDVNQELDVKLLYVAMTRPLHKLHFVYHEQFEKYGFID